MTKSFIFDQPHATRIVEARQEFLRKTLPEFQGALGLRTALDAGCGVGYFSGFLREMGFEVMAFDGRAENVEEARQRHAGVSFRVGDVEDMAIRDFGAFDFTLCFGLLYHLENPVRAMRNLASLTGKLLFLESMCVPGDAAVLHMRDEPRQEDQGLNSLGLYPTEAGLIKMAYRAGFTGVYRFAEFPDHDDFHNVLGRAPLRTVLAAAKVPLHSAALSLMREPKTASDPWSTDPTGAARLVRKLGRALKPRAGKSAAKRPAGSD